MLFIRMKSLGVLLIFFIILKRSYATAAVTDENDEENQQGIDEDIVNVMDEHNIQVAENRLAAQLFALIEHYKQSDPVGLPGAPIPDPMDVPDMKKSIGMATLNMLKVKAYGLSKFRIISINIDLEAMQVESIIGLDEMVTRGQYTMNSFWSKSSGPFTVALKQVTVKGIASLMVEDGGTLTADRIKMDITFVDMTMNFEDLGLLGSIFQSIVNSAPNLVFDSMKPFMLQEADKQIRNEINSNIPKIVGDRLLPNSITPLDMAIAEGRRYVRDLNYDPYHIADYNRTVGIFSIHLTNTWLMGISSFYRVGDMRVTMQNNTISILLHIGTQEIAGSSEWEIGGGLVSRTGHIQFSVQHIRLKLNLSQPLDTRQKPTINDLQIDLGNIQIRFDGAGTLDYIIEFVVNILPNLLRYQIMDALENPIRLRLQEKLNTIDVEQAIKENLSKFQNDGKLSFDFKI